MDRITYNGVPMWLDARGQLFMFEHIAGKEPLQLGTMDHGLFPDWKERVAERLGQFRGGIVKRLRKPDTAAATAKK